MDSHALLATGQSNTVWGSFFPEVCIDYLEKQSDVSVHKNFSGILANDDKELEKCR